MGVSDRPGLWEYPGEAAMRDVAQPPSAVTTLR